MKKIPISIATSALLAISLLTVSPANASEGPVVSDVINDESQLTYSGFDEAVAADNGYDIRTDSRGVKYSIPADAPQSSMEGAFFLPGQEPTSGSTVTPFNTVWGNCGSATLTGSGRSFFTAYAITNGLKPVSHVWRVAVSSTQGYKVFNLDGLAPLFSNTWSTSRSIKFQGNPYNGWISTGKSYLNNGVVCIASRANDRWTGL